jgi:hypothetical protein
MSCEKLSDLLPPQEIVNAAEKIREWMEENGYKNWQLNGVCDRRFVEKIPDAEELRAGLFPITLAQEMLEENYHLWNDQGKKHAINSACEHLRNAHNRISNIYAKLIGLPVKEI